MISSIAEFTLSPTLEDEFNLYMRGVFSLGKTAEWSGLTIEAVKEALAQQGVMRAAEETPDEIKQMAQTALRMAGRVP